MLPLIIAAFALLAASQVATAEHNLLDLSCSRDIDCISFQVPEMHIGARCVNRGCLCFNESSTLAQPCQPVHLATANLVGGKCPCQLRYSTCVSDYCVCERNFSPSADKRRCVPNYVRMNNPCELDLQCTQSSTFSHCNATTRTCQCLANHALLNGRCQGLVAIGFDCTRDKDCLGRVAHSICAKGRCMCDPEFVASPDNTECLVHADKGDVCLEDVQCKQSLGLGGVCRISSSSSSSSSNSSPPAAEAAAADAPSSSTPMTTTTTTTGKRTCECEATNYVLATVRTGNRTRNLCENRKAIGDTCTKDLDCQQLQPEAAGERPPLECNSGECGCSAANGYDADTDERYCVKRGNWAGSDAVAVAALPAGLLLQFIAFTLLGIAFETSPFVEC